ncbi:MAG TPA: 4Fe-4S binding protein, partial [Longimicrobiales bacterium]|nr:4Fe-4S binding protein [Longimicrobiales bacterium]
LTFVFDRGRPELGTFRVDYMSRAGLVRMAEAEPAVEAQPIPEAERAPGADAVADPEAEILVGVDAAPTDGAPEEGADAANDAAEESSVVAATPATSSVAPRAARQLGDPDLSSTGQDEAPRVGGGGAARTRVLRTALVILLAWAAFLTKNAALRWASLAATMLILGWIDGGFLSISHVTGLVWVGLSAIGSDPALLVMVVFTVATVLLWGRVFCGFLCPFGALQDLIDRVVPRRFKRELPPRVHRAAWKAKYAILAIIVGAAVMGAQVSLYQYFEPFGTVFFLSSNALLWTIACAFLIASAVVPRFYCRYVCPLGGLLAIGSLLSLRRIPRVEQCDHCRVCEQQCPTGAIDGPAVSFSECVRCNVCEVQLRERRGVCRHDMEDVRPRLVQIRRAQGVAREPVIGSR